MRTAHQKRISDAMKARWKRLKSDAEIGRTARTYVNCTLYGSQAQADAAWELLVKKVQA